MGATNPEHGDPDRLKDFYCHSKSSPRIVGATTSYRLKMLDTDHVPQAYLSNSALFYGLGDDARPMLCHQICSVSQCLNLANYS